MLLHYKKIQVQNGNYILHYQKKVNKLPGQPCFLVAFLLSEKNKKKFIEVNSFNLTCEI